MRRYKKSKWWITFWNKLDKTNYCWIWKEAKWEGYGIFRTGKIKQAAHRVSWLLTYGKIPKGMFVCHKCDNPSCANPNHLFLGTPKDNIQDALRKGRLARGELSNKKLTEDNVLAIRSEYEPGRNKNKNTYGLALKYKITSATVSKIIRRDIWTHI